MPAPLILASASPSRRQLLGNAGLAFEIEPSGVDEDEVTRSLLGEQASPQDIATILAEMKAVRVSSRHPASFVIGADSTLACNGRLFDKPVTLAAARQQLLALAGQTHELCSSVVVAKGQAVAAQIFRPFTTGGRAGGAGLGLAIARDIARIHGGDIMLAETSATGTRFRFTLPA